MPRRPKKVQRSTLRAVIYCRVSSDKQEEDGTSLDSQEENGIAYAQSKGYIVVKVVREAWTGWELTERKKLSEIREMGRNDEFDVLIFNTIDRLARNKTHFSVLVYEADHFGFRLECVKESIDNSPMGQYIRDTYGLLAELERAKIIDRTQTGRRKRVQNGKMLPGVKARFGYRWGGEHKDYYLINEDEAKVIREIFDCYTSTKASLHGLTQMLYAKNYPSPSGRVAWNRSGVFDILSDPIYIGEAYAFRYDGHHLRPKSEWIRLPEEVTVVVKDEKTGEEKLEKHQLVPPIIDRETWNKAQKLLKIRREESMRNNPYEPTELLRCGFVKCGYCGRQMVVNRYKRTLKSGAQTMVTVYACRHFYKEGGTPPCKQAPTVVTNRLDAAVWEYVGELLKDFELVEMAVKAAKGKRSFKADLQSIDRSINGLKAQQQNLVESLTKVKGTSKELVINKLNSIEEDLRRLAVDRAKIESGQIEWQKMQDEIDDFVTWGRAFKDTYETATYEEKRRALRHFGIVAYVYTRDDPGHEQWDIKVTIPDLRDIVLGATIPPKYPFAPANAPVAPRISRDIAWV